MDPWPDQSASVRAQQPRQPAGWGSFPGAAGTFAGERSAILRFSAV